MKSIALLLCVLGTCVAGLAQDTPATQPAPSPIEPAQSHPPARTPQEASAHERRAEQDALNQYRKSLLWAREALVQELKAIQQVAVQAGRVADAAALADQIEAAQHRLDALKTGWTASVLATGGWQHVLTVPRGKYHITATGLWSSNPHNPLVGPDGYKDNKPYTVNYEGALLIRINGNIDLAFSDKTIELTNDENYLEMEMSDSDRSDNRGSIDVVITEQQ